MVSNNGCARGSSLGQKKFSWSNSNFSFDSTFSKDEFLNSCFQNSSESYFGMLPFRPITILAHGHLGP